MSIIEKDGKAHSVRTPEEIAEVLKRDIETLTKEEREVLQILMDELGDEAYRTPQDALINGGPTRLYDMLAASEYKHTPVDIRTFVKDEYYLGNTCSGLYPKLLDDLEEIFNGGYKEVIVTGSIGFGKTYVSSIAVCRCLYELSCLKDPHKSFGIAPGSNIAFVAFSITENLASKVVFENIATKIESSPYFQEHFPFKQTKKDMEFPGNIWVASRAANMGSALGLNIMGFLQDEVNFLKAPTKATGNVSTDGGTGVQDTAQLIYDQMIRRMKSRFQRRGKLPGLALIVSSKKTKDDFTAKRIRESKDDPDVFVIDYNVWQVAPPDRFSSERFHVLVGNETTPSRILTNEEAVVVKEKTKETGLLVLDVPIDFRNDFENDLEGCVVGDTLIPLLDGREVAIADLVDEEEFWTYSFRKNGRFYPGRGHSARKTKSNAPIIEVGLDNGQSIKCTPDHRFMMRDGTYREAKDLVEGDSLMPFYRRVDSHGYELVKSNVGGKWVHTHRLVAREAHLDGQDIKNGEVVHHIDFNRRNNIPTNLRVMTNEDHITLHSSFLERSIHSPEAKKKAAASRLKLFQENEGYRVPEYKRKYPDHPSSKGGRIGCHNRWHGGDIDLCEKCNPPPNNHKVVYIKDTGFADVYDITVDGIHNFSTSAGVVIHNSIRDIGGASTVSISPFISNREAIVACTDINRKHPFSMEEWDQSKGGSFLWDKLARMQPIRDGAHVFKGWQPIFYPGLPRHIHIDSSLKTDFTGIAMGTVIGHKHVERRNQETQETYLEPSPMIWVDFLLRVVPPVGGEIDLGMIRGIVYELQGHGFHISKLTMDQWNSASSIQKFRTKGITCELLSVDKPIDAYVTLKSALYENRVSYYDYQPLLSELRTIQHDRTKNKVDHPAKVGGKKGSKDVSDALAGIVYSLTTDYRGNPMGIMKGISTHPDPLIEEVKSATEPEEPWFPFLIG